MLIQRTDISTIQPFNSSVNPLKVSIIMNCLNCEKYLREAIDSIYAQTYKNWEIIFWDNASTDKSAEIANSYDARLRYFRNNKTTPLGKARNMAIGQARGEYISFLDCDDLWLPEKLEKQVHVLENQPKIHFIYSNYFRIIMPSNRLVLGLRRKQPEGDVFERFLYQYSVNMQTVMLRKTTLDQFDIIFDDKLNLSEEFDLFMRILYRSKAAYLDEPLAAYRIHPDMSSIRFIEHYPDEVAYIIEKFKHLDPLFEKKYSAALNYLNAKLGYWRARADMAHGNNRRAREHLRPYIWIDYKFFVLYITLSYLPLRFWNLFHYFWNRIK